MIRSTTFLFVLSIMSVFACGGEDTSGPGNGTPAVASVVVRPNTATLVSLGETVQLTVTARDAGGSAISGKAFTWTSSDEDVATVSSTGLVTAAGANGSATITATSDGVAGTASIIVDQAVAMVRVMPESLAAAVGELDTLSAEAFDALGSPVIGVTFGWTSSNGTIATVDGNGTTSALAVGLVTITATAETIDGTAELTVRQPQPLIAFIGAVDVGTADEQYDLYVVQPVSGTVTRINNDSALDFSPTWSPDRSEIAFASERNGQRDIWAIAPDGTGLRQVNNDAQRDQGVRWSPDGQFLAFEHLNPGNQIWRMTPSGLNLQLLAGQADHSMAQHPTWFPSSAEIAYDAVPVGGGSRELWIMDAGGTNKAMVPLPADSGSKFMGDVSPDGQRLAFSWRPVAGESLQEIYIANRDGSGITQVTNNQSSSYGPVWSPDGLEIAFTVNNRIWLIKPDGSDLRQLTFFLSGVFGMDW